jgi:hypothetical protein
MPEALDEFIGVELRWGAIKVVTAEDKADCVAAFGRQATRTELKTSGSSLVPADASKLRACAANLPSSDTWFAVAARPPPSP